ncbi:MAG TPA: alkaline phosphatase family protein [Thermoanaerobaculia bacterium]|nr:alkaline phosphatase family protein [Thermoanaerobaculia bacterium]
MVRQSRASTFRCVAAVGGICAFWAGLALAGEGVVPTGVPQLDHVFVIMMENHAYAQIVGNPSSPFTNQYMKQTNAATNYFAVAHPSLTNYLEVVGGSNFGVLNDNSPDWHNAKCTPNIVSGTTSYDVSSAPPVCPIAGTGTDAATPVFDLSNETSPPSITSVTNIDGVLSIPAASGTVGKTIGDQLVERGSNWKSYQESLPPTGADRVNNSDGYYSDVNPIKSSLPAETQTLINLYAVKHNPFAYFRSVQEGASSGNGLANTVGFDGPGGLFADLASGQVPAFSFIAPNQCNDQHGRGNAGPSCDFDPSSTGTQAGLNPALIYRGDRTIQTLVEAIHASPAWNWGHNAIVVLWDENDYSATPNTNQVLLTVETNYGVSGVQSSNLYTHFSLLRTLEAGFGLPCLNHACDASVAVMADLFAPASPAQSVPASPARFLATVTWAAANGSVGSGNLTYISSETKGFWFFSPDNIDLVVKVLDGRALNGKFWVIYGSLTNVQFTLTVTDTFTGAKKTYTNAQGQMTSGADTAAF